MIKMEEIDKMNLENYKDNSKNYYKLIKKIVRALPSETLINELKRRKLVKFDWIKEKYVATESTAKESKDKWKEKFKELEKEMCLSDKKIKRLEKEMEEINKKAQENIRKLKRLV